MLDPRIYRAAFVGVLLAVLVVAFSLQDRPRPIGTTLAPDTFDDVRAFRLLDELATAFPDRRPGGAGDAALARRIAVDLRRNLRVSAVRTQQVRARTIDGAQDLTNVIATRPGAPGPGIVVVAHRDAAGRGARAELSGTAALLELARVAGGGQLKRTITFVSTSGGSGGAAGARAVAGTLPRPVDAVLVLGDLAGERVRKPFVSGWSDGGGVAPLRLRRTVEAAVRTETGSEPGGPRAATQWARLAVPLSLGEQAVLGAAGLSAVLISAGGERPPAADAPVSGDRLRAFGRSVLRAVFALDSGPDVAAGPVDVLVTQRKVLPGWAVRLLIAALFAPVLFATVDGLARANRRRGHVGAWLTWVLATALPFALVAGAAVLLRLVGLIDPAPPGPAAPGVLSLNGAGAAALAVLVIIFALGWIVLRRAVLRAVGAAGPIAGPGPAAATMTVLCLLAIIVWVRNPFAAGLLVPAAHLWLAAVAPELRLARPLAVAAVVLGAAPFAIVAAMHAGQLGYDPIEALWTAVLLVAGGHVGALGWLAATAVIGCGICAGLVALHPPPRVEAGPGDVTVRGPLSYAGPGSLGGTESALRR